MANETNGADQRLGVALFLLRLGVAIVMVMWSLDKVVNPGHAGKVFAGFYGLEGLGATAFTILGIVQLVIVLGFLVGAFKFWTYGLVLIMHAISTLVSFPLYLGFDNLLFFAAWPMLAACIALFMLRDRDRTLSVTIGNPPVTTVLSS